MNCPSIQHKQQLSSLLKAFLGLCLYLVSSIVIADSSFCDRKPWLCVSEERVALCIDENTCMYYDGAKVRATDKDSGKVWVKEESDSFNGYYVFKHFSSGRYLSISRQGEVEVQSDQWRYENFKKRNFDSSARLKSLRGFCIQGFDASEQEWIGGRGSCVSLSL